jgi:hypothetical protein
VALDATALIMVVLGVAVGLVGLLVPALRAGRRGLLIVGVLLVAAGGVFGLVATNEALGLADAPVLGWMIAARSPDRTALAETVSLVGGTTFTGALAVVAAIVLALRGRRVRAVVWVVGVALGSLTIRLVKVAVERPRPPVATRLADESTASLPSGHSLMAALGVGLTVAAVVTLTEGTRRAGAVRAGPTSASTGPPMSSRAGCSVPRWPPRASPWPGRSRPARGRRSSRRSHRRSVTRGD